MAARRSKSPRTSGATTQTSVDDPQIERALAEVREALGRLQAARSRAVVQADLAIGTNKVRHGLGRAVEGYSITATTVSAAFAHAIVLTNPRPELEVWIEVVGTSQTGARIEVW